MRGDAPLRRPYAPAAPTVPKSRCRRFASIFVALLSLVIGALVSVGDPGSEIQLPQGTVWL
jgi:hypothetical protein